MGDAAAAVAEAERSVFGDSPAVALDSLAALDAVGLAATDPALAARAEWVRGVALGAGGRYGSALAVLLPLASALPVGAPPPAPALLRWHAAAAVAAASIYRQLGLFADALAWDTRAQGVTIGRADCAGVRFEAVLGTAADAVGTGSIDAARTRLAAATELLEALPATAWRERVRFGWVACEVALLGGDPPAAAAAAGSAAAIATAHGARRHLAKSSLFEAVAGRLVAGAAADRAAAAAAEALLVSAAELAEEVGALPLVWVAGRICGQWLAASDPAAAARWHGAAGEAVWTIAADLPPDLRMVLSRREDAAELLAGPRG